MKDEALAEDDAGAVAMSQISQQRTLGEAVSNIRLSTVAVARGAQPRADRFNPTVGDDAARLRVRDRR